MFHGFGSFWKLQMEEGLMCRHAPPPAAADVGAGGVWARERVVRGGALLGLLRWRFFCEPASLVVALMR